MNSLFGQPEFHAATTVISRRGRCVQVGEGVLKTRTRTYPPGFDPNVGHTWSRLGMGNRLLAASEKSARKDGLTILTVDGHLAADRLFLEQSWIIVEKQSNTTNSVDQTHCRIKNNRCCLSGQSGV